MELRLELLLGIISIITIGSNIIPGGKLNKRVFYYSVELFCLILLDYSVWKMYQTNFFHFFRNGIFFKLLCNILTCSDNKNYDHF
jgi:hypothetical protein